MRQAEEELQTLLLIQAAFEVATMRHAVGPSLARTRSLAFVLPGIGGVTAGGAATGVRVVISAEWLEAMRHLIAVGAITTVEVAKLAGVSSLANSVSDVRGGPWTPRFEKLFKRAGMDLNDALNKVRVRGHRGPHPEAYHQAVYDRLIRAVRGLRSGSVAYRDALQKELELIGKEVARPGSTLNRLLTGG